MKPLLVLALSLLCCAGGCQKPLSNYSSVVLTDGCSALIVPKQDPPLATKTTTQWNGTADGVYDAFSFATGGDKPWPGKKTKKRDVPAERGSGKTKFEGGEPMICPMNAVCTVENGIAYKYVDKWVCEDKKRFLLQRSDGKWRCVRF